MILVLIPAAVAAGQATLSWLPNTEPNLAGYKVYFGQASRTYQAPVDVANSIGYTLTGLQEGVVYYFAVTAYNSGGESAFSSEVSLLVTDTTPPAISAVAVPVKTTGGATITWTTNEASDSQVEYGTTTAYGNLTTLNVSLVTSHLVTLSGLVEGRLYHFRLRSRDAAGNLATSGDFTFSTLDGTPPSVSITAPAAGVSVSGTVTVSASALDNVGVAGVQFKLDGANLGAEDTAAPYAVAWNTSGASVGAHTLTAVARDAAGNTATAAAVSVTVANVLTITSFTPPYGPEGYSVTITGKNFTGATAVTFNGVSASFTVTAPMVIQATVPKGATTGPLSVTTPGGTVTSFNLFTVTPLYIF